MLCALIGLLLSTLVRQTKYSFKFFRLRHVSTMLSSIGRVVRSLLDNYTSKGVCCIHIIRTPFTFFHYRYFSLFPRFWTFGSIDFLLPPSHQYCPHVSHTSKILAPPMQKTEGWCQATNVELVWRHELQLLAKRIRSSGAHPVEDVIVAFFVVLWTDARLLEQVMRDEATTHLVLTPASNSYCTCLYSVIVY